MKGFFLFLLSLLAGFLFASSAYSAEMQIPAPTDRFYINDFANVLSDDTEQHIFETSKQLHEQTSAQIVVATITSLDGRDIESYATTMFRDWGIGDSDKNSGLLLLVSTQDRKLRIEVGYGLEGILPDGKVGRIRDEFVTPHLKEDNWDLGIRAGYDAIFAIIDENREEIGKPPSFLADDDWIFILIVFGIIGLLIFLAIRHPHLGNPTNNPGRHRSSSSGGWSSGSSSGGGFSGGGGSSGGGGASGSF